MARMSKPHRLRLCFCGVASVVALFAPAAAPQTLPSTQVTCPASGPMVTTQASTPFSAWFTPAGTPPNTLNAAVSPADSLNFSNNTGNNNTDFYRWSYRMFLWLTSPTPSTYGGTGLVMSSPEFYNVAPNAAGVFVMTPNPVNPFLRFGPIKAIEMARANPPAPLHLGLRIANLGPHDLPLVHDTAGNFFEVLPAKLSAAGKPLVLSTAGKEVELGRVAKDAQGQPQFLDKTGAAVGTLQLQVAPQVLRKIGMDLPALQKLAQPQFVFMVDPSVVNGNRIFPGGPIFILPNGAVIPTVVGDSDGNVQLTQAGSLIYYGIAVNDAYAYYVTQINPTVTNNTTAPFPTDQAQLTSIQNFATTKGHTLLDPNSLAMEIKTAWVDASTLTNPKDYITMSAVVPTYNKNTAAAWTQNGTKTITVALIGMHVVGSVAGHPEMVWSTFEHTGNTPNVAYVFDNPSGTQQTQPADPVNSTTHWLFCGATSPPSNGTPAEFTPKAQAAFSPAGVNAVNGATSVQGTSVLRLSPWGAPDNQTPNPLIASVAASNTQIISLNNDIHSQMNAADVRNNYLFLGATWTEGGAAPSSNFNGTNLNGIVVGTSHLANSTLETFTQSAIFVTGTSPTSPVGPGCLACHRTNTVSVSHVFTGTQALP